jgi:hypothetical protein
MRPSDIISHLGLTIFPIVGLIIFVAVFAAVTVRALRTRREDINRFAVLPFEGGEASDRTIIGEQSHV